MTSRWLTVALLGLLAVVPYVGAFAFDFAWDGRAFILEKEHIQDSRLPAAKLACARAEGFSPDGRGRS